MNMNCFMQVTLFFQVRRKPECDKQMNEMISKSKNKPIQLAYVVEPGEDIKLMCHYW